MKKIQIVYFFVIFFQFYLLYTDEIINNTSCHYETKYNLLKLNNDILKINNSFCVNNSRYVINSATYSKYREYKTYRGLSFLCRGLSIIPWLFSYRILFHYFESFAFYNSSRIISFIFPLSANILDIFFCAKKSKLLPNIISDKNLYRKKYTKGIIITQAIAASLWAGSTIIYLTGRYRNEFGENVYEEHANFSAIGYILAVNLHFAGIQLAISKKHLADKKPVGDVFLGGSKKGIIAGYRMSF